MNKHNQQDCRAEDKCNLMLPERPPRAVTAVNHTCRALENNTAVGADVDCVVILQHDDMQT
jgi:hypothetical protein